MNMQTENNDKKPNSLRLYIIAGIAALLAGFMAVYVNLTPSGNGDITAQSKNGQKSSAKVQNEATQSEKTPQSGLKGLNKGQMTAFVVYPKPKDLKEVKFTDGEGNPKTLKDWQGKVVLLNLWATWCGPCRHEMPSLDRLRAKLASDNFDLIAVSIDRGGLEKPAKFLESIEAKSLKLYHDGSATINTKLLVFGMPTTILINRDGKEIGRLAGPAEWDSEEAVKLIEAAIAGES